MTATPNHALPRTAPGVTFTHFPLGPGTVYRPRNADAPPSAVAELGVVRPLGFHRGLAFGAPAPFFSTNPLDSGEADC